MSQTKPKISENVMKKADRLLRDGWVQPYPDGNFQVKGSKPDTSYYVQIIEGKPVCECEAEQHGNNNCAHVIAVMKYDEYQRELKKKKKELKGNDEVDKQQVEIMKQELEKMNNG